MASHTRPSAPEVSKSNPFMNFPPVICFVRLLEKKNTKKKNLVKKPCVPVKSIAHEREKEMN